MKPSMRSTLVILPDVPLGNISAGDESAGPEAPSPPAPAGNSTLTWAKQCCEETEKPVLSRELEVGRLGRDASGFLGNFKGPSYSSSGLCASPHPSFAPQTDG